MNSLIVGASAGLGRALSNELPVNGHNLVLVSSDKRDIEAVAADMGGIDGLFFPIGAVADADVPGVKIATMRRIMRINLLSVMETVTRHWHVLFSHILAADLRNLAAITLVCV